MIEIGIDPGKDGAVGVINGNMVAVEDTPTFEIKTKRKTKKGNNKIKREYDVHGMASIMKKIASCGPCRVMIEQVHSMPEMGAPSVFDFGKGYGIWIGIVTAMGLPLEFVTPQTWKKAMLQGMSSKEKVSSVVKARQLFPVLADVLIKSKDGRSEALLMAEYLRRTRGGA